MTFKKQVKKYISNPESTGTHTGKTASSSALITVNSSLLNKPANENVKAETAVCKTTHESEGLENKPKNEIKQRGDCSLQGRFLMKNLLNGVTHIKLKTRTSFSFAACLSF